MAAPTAPTLDSLTIEGLKKAGYPDVVADDTDQLRAEDWVEEVKNDIWNIAKKLKVLQSLSVQVTTNGLSKYSMPTDFSSPLSMSAMHGSRIGTAQTGANTTVTVAASSTYSELDILGKEIFIYSGTGASSLSVNNLRQITAYNSTTKVATVDSAWDTNPDSTSKYMIVDIYYPLTQKPIERLDDSNHPTIIGRPTHYCPIGDVDNGEFYLYDTPYHSDAPFGIKQRYYADLTRVDLASTLIATLYRRWRSLFIQGVFAKALQNDNDARADKQTKKYERHLALLVARETYGMDLSNMRVRVNDY